MNNNANITQLPPLERGWELPILFDEIETPDIPAKLLPSPLAEFAAAQATATETPEALSVMTILGIISAVGARYFKVSPKKGWNESLNIYTVIGLPPANNKSLVLKHCTQPLELWEQEQAERLQPEIMRQLSERKTEEKIIEALRTKAAKEKDSLMQKEIIKAIVSREANLIEPPVLPRLFANDTTPEALVKSVYEQGGHYALISDEGGLIETLGGLYSGGHANVDILLKGIDGGHLRVRRKDRSLDLNPFLTVVMAVQPVIIQNMSARRAYLGNGALERFLYVLPKSKLGYRTHDKPPIPEHITHAYHKVIRSLLDLFTQIPKDQWQSNILTLSSQAYQEWRCFQQHIETELRPNGRLSTCLGWGGKICGFALRIAGLLHIAEYGVTNLVISDKTMANALEIAALLCQHAVTAFGLMSVDEATQDAKEIFQWLKANGKTEFTKTDITYAMRNRKLGKPDRLINALGVLIERDIISEPEQLPTRKPTALFHVNPALVAFKGD